MIKRGSHVSENSQPVVSVVTPAYNQAAYLPATIESVLAQDYSHIEYRVIDDGSTDRTDSIVRKYAAAYEWIELVRRPERLPTWEVR